MSESQAPSSFGRVDADGTVYVREGDTERSVGQIPDSTPEEAMAFYVRRFENLAAEVGLLESRVAAQAMSPEEARTAIGTARSNVAGANAVGDLAAVGAPGAALDHRVGLGVVGEAGVGEGPRPGLGEGVGAGVGQVEGGDGVDVGVVEAESPVVLVGQVREGGGPDVARAALAGHTT